MYNSGYVGYSMSVRAVDAYDSGLKPLSKWTKAGIINAVRNADLFEQTIDNDTLANELGKIKFGKLKEELLVKEEWHHTSCMYNATDFYGIDTEKLETLTIEEIGKWGNYKEDVKEITMYRGNLIYLEWSGTKKHPKAKERCLENVVIVEKGCFYIAYDDNGNEIMRKKMDSRGTKIERI